MKRILIVAVLSLALVLGVGATSLAAPQGGGEAASFFLFGEYAPVGFDAADIGYGFAIGGGFALLDNINVGIELQYGSGALAYGAFANLALGPIAASGELLLSSLGNGYAARVQALFLIDLSVVEASAGLGVVYNFYGDLGLAGVLKAGVGIGPISVYGAMNYYIYGPFSTDITIGATYAF